MDNDQTPIMGKSSNDLTPEARASYLKGYRAALSRRDKDLNDENREIKSIMYNINKSGKVWTNDEVIVMAYEYGYKTARHTVLTDQGHKEEDIDLKNIEIDQSQFDIAKSEVMVQFQDANQSMMALMMYPRGYKNGKLMPV